MWQSEVQRQRRQANTAADPARPQKKRTAQKHLEKGSGEGNVDGGLQVQSTDEDGGGGSRQSSEMDGVECPTCHGERQAIKSSSRPKSVWRT